MLYTKTKLKDGTTVNTEIRPDNTFTKCSECGKEISVCLNGLFHSDCNAPHSCENRLLRLYEEKLGQDIKPEMLVICSTVRI